MSDPIPAAEFTRNFGRYRMMAQRKAVAVSSHGTVTGYFVGPDEYADYLRFKARRQSFATADLSSDLMDAIASADMDPRHEPLDRLLKPD